MVGWHPDKRIITNCIYSFVQLEAVNQVAVGILVLQHPLAGFDAEPLTVNVLGQPLPGLEAQNDRRGELTAVGNLAAAT